MSELTPIPSRPTAPLPVGISQCLLGETVRYDGTGAASSFPAKALAGLFEYRPLCPEVGIGMSVPRAPIRLVGNAAAPRARGTRDRALDVTDQLQAFASERREAIADLAGYVFMHNSPSCGTRKVKVYERDDVPAARTGRGIFAAAVMQAQPNLPVEDAGRLFDEVLRENFVTRVFAYAHWQALAPQLSAAGLIAFHARYKYLLMAHSQTAYREAGRILSDLKHDLAAKAEAYIAVLMSGLCQPASRGGHANVLGHLAGYLKKALDSPSRQELDALIQAYRRGEAPLMAPLALLQHHLRLHPDEYVLNQIYLQPHPAPAGLRRAL